jgi:exodeoxyribonuclease VII large subunit
MSPQNVMKRGYSITQINGKAITGIDHLQSGDILNTIIYEGNITSIVKSIQKTEDHE